MAAARYFDLVREMRDAYNHRLRLVQHARQRGNSRAPIPVMHSDECNAAAVGYNLRIRCVMAKHFR